MDVADCAERDAATRFKRVQHALALAVLNELLLVAPEVRWIKWRELDVELIGAAVAAFDRVALFALKSKAQQSPRLGQRMIGRSCNFAQCHSVVGPGNPMPGARDANVRNISPALNRACLLHLEQLRMQRSIVELHNKFCDFGTNDRQTKKLLNPFQTGDRTSDDAVQRSLNCSARDAR